MTHYKNRGGAYGCLRQNRVMYRASEELLEVVENSCIPGTLFSWCFQLLISIAQATFIILASLNSFLEFLPCATRRNALERTVESLGQPRRLLLLLRGLFLESPGCCSSYSYFPPYSSSTHCALRYILKKFPPVLLFP